MALQPGVHSLDRASPSTSAIAKQPSGPPKAIFLKLSDAAFQQLKSAGSEGIPKLTVELDSGSNIPTAFNIGDSSYTITKRAATVVTSDQNLNEVLVASSSSLAKGKGRATSDAGNSSGLFSIAPPCREAFSIAPGLPRKAIVQKTAENMAERIRERNAQLEREKVGRRVVVVDDESLLANGKKGKGKKVPAKGPASASSLLRTSAIAAKRSPSPAGISPRNSPIIGAATRAPSRLIANEAAKGLISRKEKEKQKELETATGADAKISQQQPIQATVTTVPLPGVASSHQVSEKVRLASSSSSTSSRSSTSSSISSNPSTSTSVSSAPSLPTIKTSPSLPAQSEQANPDTTAPASQQQQAPKLPPQKYHQARQDDSDLASASSSSEDESATIPLARRIPSPVKTNAPPLPMPVQAPVVKPPASSSAKSVSTAKAASPPRPAKAVAPPIKKVSPVQKASAVEAFTAEAHTAIVQAARPAQATAAKNQTLLTSASASTSRSSSADRASSSSSSSSDDRAIAADKSAQLARKRKLEESEAPVSKESVGSSPQLTVSAPEVKKPRRSSGSNGSGGQTGPKTAAKTAGGSRLSKPLPKRSPVQSGRTSPLPPVSAPTLAPAAPSAVPIIAVPSHEQRKDVTVQQVSVSPKVTGTVTPPKPQAGQSSRATSPAGHLSAAKATTSNLSPLVIGTPSGSRGGSPLPSPTAHPLPPKPTTSAVPPTRPSPAHTASHRSPNLQAKDAVKAQPVVISAPPSPVPAYTSLPKTLPASLPARPSTIMPPTGSSDRRDSRDARMVAATESRHTSRHGNGTSSTLPSGTTSGASSPIVSHFPKKTDNGRLSAPSSAANTPKLSSSASFGKVANSPAAKLDSSVTKKRKSSDRSVSSDRSAKKQSKAGFTRAPSHSKSEKEEGEEPEEEEGEVDAEGESDDEGKKLEESQRGRSTEKKSVASSNIDTAKSNSKPRKVTDSSSLPSFKKGRAAELLAAEGKGASGRRSSSVSRADTPISHSPAREESPLPSRKAAGSSSTNLHISTDEEFRDFSRKFTEELFPSYSKLYKRLEEVQNGLTNGRKGLKMTAQELLKQVEDVNQRGRELNSIREALSRYNDEKQRQTIKS